MEIEISIDLMFFRSVYKILRYNGNSSVAFICFILIVQATFDLLSVLSFYPFFYLLVSMDGDVFINDRYTRVFWGLKESFGLSDTELLFYVAIICLTFVIFSNLYRTFSGYFINKYSEDLRSELSLNVIKESLKHDLSVYDRFFTEGLAKKAIIEPDLFVDQVCRPLLYAVGAIFSSFFIIISLLVLSAEIFILIIAPMIIYYSTVLLMSKKSTRRYGRIVASSETKRINYVNDLALNIKGVLLDRRSNFFTDRFEKALDSYAQAKTRYQTLLLVPSYGLEALVFSAVIIGSVLVVLFNQSSPEIVTSYAGALGTAIAGLYKIKPNIHVVYQAFLAVSFGATSVSDIGKIFSLPEPVQSDSDSVDNKVQLGLEAFGSFAYDHKILFKDMSFIATAGSAVAVTGESGSGKSTLVDLVLGLRPSNQFSAFISSQARNSSKDKIVFGGLKGIALYVPQEPMVLNESILSNITLAGSEVSDDSNGWALQCLELAGLGDWVSSLENGLNSVLGNGGVAPSGGQKKRIALARALFPRPRILVLDEFTSGLDEETAITVLGKLISYSKGKFTLICITHSSRELFLFDTIVRVGIDK